MAGSSPSPQSTAASAPCSPAASSAAPLLGLPTTAEPRTPLPLSAPRSSWGDSGLLRARVGRRAGRPRAGVSALWAQREGSHMGGGILSTQLKSSKRPAGSSLHAHTHRPACKYTQACTPRACIHACTHLQMRVTRLPLGQNSASADSSGRGSSEKQSAATWRRCGAPPVRRRRRGVLAWGARVGGREGGRERGRAAATAGLQRPGRGAHRT